MSGDGLGARGDLGKVKAMPDQSSASSEHAIMQEITAPLATLPDDAVPVAADVDFPIVLRGYDRIAVDAYVKKTSQLVAELQATRSPEAAVRRALERVGEEVAGILQRAHDTASQITTQSRSEAEDRLEAARREATDISTEAADRVKELDLETDRIWEERLRIVEDARDLARQLLALADSAAQRFPAEETESTESVSPEVAEVFAAAAAASAARAADEEHPDEEPAEPVDERAAEGLAPGSAPAPFEEHRAGDDEEDPDRDATMVMPPIRLPEPGAHPSQPEAEPSEPGAHPSPPGDLPSEPGAHPSEPGDQAR